MKKIVARLMLCALVTAPIVATAACPAEEPKKEEPPPPPPPPPPPAAPTIPEYTPAGEDADLKKQGAAGIDDKNASAKASELEGAIDAQIKDLEAKKAAAPHK